MPASTTSVRTARGRKTSARAHALAVQRVRGTALALALLPAAAAVILLAAKATGTLSGWDTARWVIIAVAALVLAVTTVVAAVIARARPALTPTVAVERTAAPDLYTLVHDLADRLDVPVPSAIALTPDCDSWLEDRTHPTHRARGADEARGRWAVRRRSQDAPVLVIGSPFLWWMRVAELRALLAPVVAGTGPSAHPDIAAARRFVRSLDAAVAGAERARDTTGAPVRTGGRDAARRIVLRFSGWVARLMLRACGQHAAEMERGVAAAAADRAQYVDRPLRASAQEQVGLAYAGWDRLLTRVALPAWRTGRWPSRLDAGVVSALTELSRRDRLAEGFTARLGERPACDLLEEPGVVDASLSLLAARLFHGEPGEGTDWSPVDWPEYPEEVVDRIWRADASRLFAALDATEPLRGVATTTAVPLSPPADSDEAPGGAAPVPARVRAVGGPPADGRTAVHPAKDAGAGAQAVAYPGRAPARARATGTRAGAGDAADDAASRTGHAGAAEPTAPLESAGGAAEDAAGTAADRTPVDRPSGDAGAEASAHAAQAARPYGRASARTGPVGEPGAGAPAGPGHTSEQTPQPGDPYASSALEGGKSPAPDHGTEAPAPVGGVPEGDVRGEVTLGRVLGRLARGGGDAVAARISAEVEREDALRRAGAAAPVVGPDGGVLSGGGLPAPMGLPLQPPRSGRELLTEHVTAVVCCAAVDTTRAAPGLDWLDGPALLVNGERVADLAKPVRDLVETGDAGPLREWLAAVGVRADKPVRLV